MSGEFSGKSVLVTGGASGIGKATVCQFFEQGANVLVTDINEEDGRALVDRLDEPSRVQFFKLDVASEKNWEDAIDFHKATFGRLDILVNSAGISIDKPLEEMPLKDWQFQNSINLDGTFLGVRNAIREMKHEGGAIVNIASILADVGFFGATGYCAGKAGVKNFTKAAALYCAQYGYKIRINAVMPGYIDTPMVQNALEKQGNPNYLAEKLRKLHPVGHFGEPEDIAAGVLFCASEKAKFMTGTSIPIDGGYLAQ
jgi:3(or 17)beta-hydroxysteroid dehydrogenase